MKSSIHCDGKLLIVGDGDFSFTVSLVRHCNLNPTRVFTSNLETEASILHHAQASTNMSSLRDLGVCVFLETDATDLHNHPVINKNSFDRIIFNFPLADRHNIKKNRSLLADFFSSCRSVLAPGGRVLVTLCKGQGGTPADQPVRSWHDSWQVMAMATNASFLLREVLPFDPAEFPEYHSVGFRFQDKSFNVSGALTHVFEEGSLVEDLDWSTRGVFESEGHAYSCNSYVASHLKRNLLEEARNPVCILRRTIEEMFRNSLPAEKLLIETGSPPVISSHKSRVFFCKKEEDDTATPESPPHDTNSKEWKNCENLKRVTKLQLAHGVVLSSDAKDVNMECPDADAENVSTVFIPTDRENVYILVKPQNSKRKEKSTNGCGEDCMELDNNSHGVKDAAGCGVSDCGQRSECDREGEGIGLVKSSTHERERVPDCSSLVYHCRTSLLENLPYLCQVMEDRTVTSTGFQGGDSDALLKGNLNADENVEMRTDSPFSHDNATNPNPNQPESDDSLPRIPLPAHSLSCLVACGQSMLPCPISPSASPIKHEMIILHQTVKTNNATTCPQQEQQLSPSTSSVTTSNSNPSHFDLVSSQITSTLHSLSSSLSPTVSPLTMSSKDSSSSSSSSLYELKMEGMGKSQLMGKITVSKSDASSNSTPSQKPPPSRECVGLIVQAASSEGGRGYLVVIMDLQRLACCLFGVDDWRLLWSRSLKFLNQFPLPPPHHHHAETTTASTQCQFPLRHLHQYRYRPFSLYPMRFVHDLSFWEGDGQGDALTSSGLCDVIRTVAREFVTDVSLIDVYEDVETKRRSRCYRLHFLSSDQCLPYVTSWKMQSRIRMEVARTLGVTLR